MRILIRADGYRDIGTGHVMRMLALAQAARARGSDVVLASVRLDAALEVRARQAGMSLTCTGADPGSRADRAWVVEQASARGIDWVVVDGYAFDASYQDEIRSAGFRLLFVDDDGACGSYAANIVLNQNVVASAALYERRRKETRLLLGPAYALLREEFLAAAAIPRVNVESASRILVTLGGADPENVTERILGGLARMPDGDMRVKVLTGPSNPHFKRLAAATTDTRIEIVAAVDDVTPLMLWAELAIASASVTVYELCSLGVPTLTVAIVEHQRGLAAALEREGMCMDLGRGDALGAGRIARGVTELRSDRRRRAELSRMGRERVDARGAMRVLEEMSRATGV